MAQAELLLINMTGGETQQNPDVEVCVMNLIKDELTEQFMYTYNHYEKNPKLYEKADENAVSSLAFDLIVYSFDKKTTRDLAIREYYEKMQYDRILTLIWVKSDCETIRQAFDIMRNIFAVTRIVVEYRLRTQRIKKSKELKERILVEDTMISLLSKEKILFRQPTLITLDGYGMYLDLLRFLPNITEEKVRKYIKDHGGVF